MSGPKKSSYEIRMERIRAQRAAKREKQKNEILNRLNEVRKIANEIGDNKIYNWIKDIENSLNFDLRDSFRSLKRLENYAKNQQIIYQDLQAYEKAKQKQDDSIKEEKTKYLLETLENIKNDYKEIVNDAILQRVEIFQQAIKANPDTQNTLKQIEQFKTQVAQMYENYLDKKESTEYVANAFQNILDGNVDKKGDNYTIEGQINGVNIKVKLNTKTNDINFDTPHTSKCSLAMQEIVNKLESQDVKLGAIKVLQTGQMLNANTQINKQRIRQ